MNRRIVTGAAALVLAGAALAGGQPAKAQASAPFAGGAPTQDAKDPAVEKLVAAAAKLEKQSKAKPKDSKLKVKVGDAYYAAGHAAMMSAALPPRTKYRSALAHFRTALKFNPDQKKAAEEKKMIEDIYKQMGRPVPQ